MQGRLLFLELVLSDNRDNRQRTTDCHIRLVGATESHFFWGGKINLKGYNQHSSGKLK